MVNRDPRAEASRGSIEGLSDDPKKPDHVPPERRRATAEPDAPGAGRYLAGDVIDSKYRLTSIIGKGGMGTVWLARNLALDIDVCVKLIAWDHATPEASLRLLQEARAAARLTHPSIVRVFDFGETQHGDPFIVMELLRGESLWELMARKRRLPATTAVAMMLPVASALVEAHAKRIVHRDLKPENIVLVSEENGSVVPKVVDFGLAKIQSNGLARGLTRENVAIGSPEYMSPEQAQGRREIDERTDVWAFSVLLYELIVGHVPFRGQNFNALLWAIQHEPPEPATAYLSGDEELWMILKRGLEKRAEDRWPSMRELGVALADWADAHQVEVDVTSASIALGWLSAPRRPLSEAPPSKLRTSRAAGTDAPRVTRDRLTTPGDPTAAQLPRSVRRTALLTAAGLVVLAGIALAVHTVPPRLAPTAAPQMQPIASDSSVSPTEEVSSVAPGAPSGSAPARFASAGRGSQPACLDSLFPPGTFGDAAVDVQLLCREHDPRRGALELKGVIVKNRGSGVSAAMREWSSLSWYEMAAFAVARTRCCPSAEPLVLPPNGGVCPPLERVLDDLGRAVNGHGDAKHAIDAFDQNIVCLVKNGGAVPYPYPHLAKLDNIRPLFELTVTRAKSATAGLGGSPP